MSEEDLIAAEQNDTGAATSGDEADAPSQTAAQSLYPEAESDEAAAEQGDESPSDEAPAGAPEKYEFQFGEGQIDQELLTEFEGMAKESNLTNDQANKFALLGTKISAKIAEKQAAMQAEQVKAWGEESRADKEFGGEKLESNLAVARTAMNEFATPQLIDLLNKSGLGNHPEVIRAFYKVGKAISPDGGVVKGKPPAPQREAKNVLYG